MPEVAAHPSRERLIAYNLGQLPPNEAVEVESHISACEPCCDTIISLSSDDTFVGLLKEARQLPTDETVDHAVATASSPPQDVPVQLAEHPRYEILSLIGRGGMGDVYQARHRKMERTVALKVINRGLFQKTEAVDRFHREVKSAAKLSHPNIVTAYDADQAGDFHFMVMEYVDGVDLSQTVKGRGALPVAEACDYIRQAAIGLQHAHERGMVHRDIKPHNLMVTSDGTVKILDFGLASLAPEAVTEAESNHVRGDLTAAGAIMGTPDFISPEQADDARKADIRSDIYSLGATLYFLLAGRPPFAEGSLTQKLKSHAQSEPEPLESLRDDVPPELVAIVRKMTAKDPDERYLTPREVADALESFSRSVEPRKDIEPPTQAKPRGWKPTFLSFTAIAALFVAALFAGLIYYVQTDHGVVRVEVTDPSLEVSINNHTITMKDPDGKPLTIRPGKQTLVVRKDDANFEFETDRFQIRRGDKIAFKVEYIKGEIVVRKDGDPFDRTHLLVGEWRGKHDADEEVRLTFNSDGTFEMVIVDPAKPQRVQNRAIGKYLADFSVSPAQLDLDGTIISPAFNPESEAAPKYDGPAEAAPAVEEPERERAVKHKFEAIIELIDANTLHLSDIEKDSRPKKFGEESLVLHRQGVKKDRDEAAEKTQQILDRMLKAYAECKSYRDSGVIKTVIVENADSPQITLEHSLNTVFERPDRFRFEIKDKDDNKVLISVKGQNVQTWWDVEPGIQNPESLDLAMVQAIGFSGADVGRIPALLMPQEFDGGVDLDLIDPKQIEDGKLQNVECFRLEYNFRDERIILWIDQQSYLVRRIDEWIKSDGTRIERTTTYDPTIDEKITDKMLEFPPEGDAADDAHSAAAGPKDPKPIWIKTDKKVEEVWPAIHAYYVKKYPKFAALAEEYAEADSDPAKLLQTRMHREIGELAITSPVTEELRTSSHGPVALFMEGTQYLQKEALITRIGLYRYPYKGASDEHCRILVARSRRRGVWPHETYPPTEPITDDELRKLVDGDPHEDQPNKKDLPGVSDHDRLQQIHSDEGHNAALMYWQAFASLPELSEEDTKLLADLEKGSELGVDAKSLLTRSKTALTRIIHQPGVATAS